MKAYSILQLKPKREKSVVQRHPWIFSGAMQKRPKAAEGDIVQVQSAEGQVLGYGFYSEQSQISCRMFHWGTDAPDFEGPEYWLAKIRAAHELRKNLIIHENTNAYRLLHAEGDFLPGIIADVYAGVVVLQVLIKGMEVRLPLITEALNALGFQNIYVKGKTSSHDQQDVSLSSSWLSGEAASPVVVLENGLKFRIDFVGGQKTGFFLDQRDNRQLLRHFSQGKKVLNTFSYTGGFSIYALAGGAAEVHSVDISAEALKMCDENVALNFAGANHKSFAADCFQYLQDMPQDDYDIIVLDPPAFAKHRGAVDKAARGYKQINLKAFQKVKRGGLVFSFSCSQNISEDLFQKIVFGAAADAGRNVRILYKLHQAPDHPINIFHPEGEYLKGLVLYVE